MFSSEIKDTINVAIGLMLAAMVLGLIAFVFTIRSDMASVRNDEIAIKSTMEAFTSFNKYQGAILYGEDVISIIREFANTDIAVYSPGIYGKRNTSNTEFYMDKDTYLANPYKFTLKSLQYGVDIDNAGENVQGFIPNGVDTNRTYFSYLVYGTYGKDEISKAKYSDDGTDSFYSEVTAIYICYVGEGRHKAVTSIEQCGCDVTKAPCHAIDIYNEVQSIIKK